MIGYIAPDKVEWNENYMPEDYVNSIKEMTKEKFEQEYLGNFELIENDESTSKS